jgi:DNA repair protein RadA/Sms
MKFTTASNVVIPSEYFNRITTGNEALDFLFGDGLLPGSTLTLSAKHGTGKTQFSLQLLELLSKKHSVGYVSNEETVEQLAFTCRRIGTPNVPIANVRTVADVVEATEGLQVLLTSM